jgi:hypothetical protein
MTLRKLTGLNKNLSNVLSSVILIIAKLLENSSSQLIEEMRNSLIVENKSIESV